MVAAGNIRTDEELDKLLDVVWSNLTYFLDNVGFYTTGRDFKDRQNYYCQMQKKNPHWQILLETDLQLQYFVA